MRMELLRRRSAGKTEIQPSPSVHCFAGKTENKTSPWRDFGGEHIKIRLPRQEGLCGKDIKSRLPRKVRRVRGTLNFSHPRVAGKTLPLKG